MKKPRGGGESAGLTRGVHPSSPKRRRRHCEERECSSLDLVRHRRLVRPIDGQSSPCSAELRHLEESLVEGTTSRDAASLRLGRVRRGRVLERDVSSASAFFNERLRLADLPVSSCPGTSADVSIFDSLSTSSLGVVVVVDSVISSALIFEFFFN